MNITVGRSITSPTFFRAQIAAFAFSKAHATLRGSRPVSGDSSGGNHVTRSVLFGEGRPDDRRLGAAPEIRGGRHRGIGTPRRSAPSQPLLDLSVHRVVSAEDLLCDNKIGCEPGRNPAT